jgi:hypothetical protein
MTTTRRELLAEIEGIELDVRYARVCIQELTRWIQADDGEPFVLRPRPEDL